MVLIITGIAETFERNLNTQQLAESIAKWRNQVAKNAEDAGAHYALGLAYLNSKLRDASLVHFRKAVLLAPEKADTHYNLALACFNDGNILLDSPDYAEAQKEIDYCVNLAPDFREAVAFKHFFVARKLQEYITDASQALVEYKVAIEACPDLYMIQNNAGLCFFRIKKYQEARTCLGRAAELSPKEPLPQIQLCNLEYQLGEYAKGIETGMRAVALLGSATLGITQAEAHNNLALCLWKSERRAEALEHINKAIAHDPQNPIFRQSLEVINQNPQAIKGCFIATACCGTGNHPVVFELQQFRDEHLEVTGIGRAVVRGYYRWSPAVASHIAKNTRLKQLSLLLIVYPALIVARAAQRLKSKQQHPSSAGLSHRSPDRSLNPSLIIADLTFTKHGSTLWH